MSSVNSERFSRVTSNLILPMTAAAISIPVVMFNVIGYDINPAFLLAPLIAIAFFMNIGLTGFLYILSALCGAASIFAVNMISPDGEVTRHIFALILILFAPSFLFLGKMVARRVEVSKVLLWLSVFSSIFVFVVAARILLLEQDVRIYVGPLGLASMNAEFFGLPVFASFGVLSLAHLICLQTMIICGSFVGGSYRYPTMVALGISLFCGTLLVVGSDSRSAQVLLVWIAGTVIAYAIKERGFTTKSSIALFLIISASLVGYSRMGESRMVESIAGISTPSKVVTSKENSSDKKGSEAADQGIAPSDSSDSTGTESIIVEKADAFATGRVELAIEGFREVKASPFLGNGFSSYGRYAEAGEKSQALSMNSSTHIYYLTLLWKGGLLFFIPFIAMLLINFKNCLLARHNTAATPERFYSWSAVLMAFGPMAMAWDILIVPSAGALAFFLFGMLAARSRVL
ncbi:O-antigen ligase family protein [Pseudomonas asiatica]|uniref:O-antigen ligase family protein n=1 Tax=Pseudomonas asiatica TaxID=2219225 RepID=A0AAJ5I047_9PSED|nr:MULTISPECIES: O-antigen ligase family protein [Pseudomonas]MCO7526407.1 O-antigen ligase family protein [Pseudomonas asiatica]MDS9589894.1 O-antigen ligase family protein [Pseudomonas sp. HTZ1]UUC20827.1 O-antigen ligase family protein [Pseudomonas asiatica]